jgi:hypothetical protein
VTLSPLDLTILRACRLRGDVRAFPRETVDSLVQRGLLDWNSPPYIANRTASATRLGLEAIAEVSEP